MPRTTYRINLICGHGAALYVTAIWKNAIPMTSFKFCPFQDYKFNKKVNRFKRIYRQRGTDIMPTNKNAAMVIIIL